MPEPVDGDVPASGPVRKDAFLTVSAQGGVLPDRAPETAAGTAPDAAGGDPHAELLDRLRRTPGLESLVAEAVATWRAREGTGDDGRPGWRAFSDAFPTFWEFSNRPR